MEKITCYQLEEVLTIYLKHKLIEVFSKNVESYDKWYSTPLGVYVREVESKALQYLLPVKGRGIDIGGGTGVFTNVLGERVWTICLDPVYLMLKKALKRGVDVICGVIEQPPLRPHSLDYAFMITVLEFLEKPLKALLSVKMLLRKWGVFVIMFINKKSLWGEVYMKMARDGDPILSLARFYTISEVEDLLNQAGFKIVEKIGVLDYPPTSLPRSSIKICKKNIESCGAVFIKSVT